MQFKVGEIVIENFTVTDENYDLVTGLVDGDFTKKLYSPDGTEKSTTIPVSISELGNGNYRISFTPDVKGNWYLVAYHSTFFPWGKAGNIEVRDNDIDNLSNNINAIAVDLTRALGLMQENFYIDNTTHDEYGNMINGRIRIYNNPSSVGSSSNVIATYHVTASFTERNMDFYKVVKQ